MAETKNRPQSHLQNDKDPIWWDWWSENPVEIILVIFILVLFFTLPRAGCGITAEAGAQDTAPQAPAATAVDESD
jgi:hypothetical protein